MLLLLQSSLNFSTSFFDVDFVEVLCNTFPLASVHVQVADLKQDDKVIRQIAVAKIKVLLEDYFIRNLMYSNFLINKKAPVFKTRAFIFNLRSH